MTSSQDDHDDDDPPRPFRDSETGWAITTRSSSVPGRVTIGQLEASIIGLPVSKNFNRVASNKLQVLA